MKYKEEFDLASSRLDKAIASKNNIKQAIIDKNVEANDVFSTYAENVSSIIAPVDALIEYSQPVSGTYFGASQMIKEIFLPEDMSEVEDMSQGFINLSLITEITLPDSMPNLRNLSACFRGCIMLSSLKIPDDSNNIETLYYAFFSCPNITSVSLPNRLDSLTDMYGIFEYCDNLEQANLPSSMNSLVRMGTAFMSTRVNISLISGYPNLEDIANIFNIHKSITTLKLDNLPKLRVITGLISNCSTVKSVMITSSVPGITVMNMAFYNCSNITSISIYTIKYSSILNVTNSFYNCTSLENLYFHDLPDSDKYTTWKLEDCINLTKESLLNVLNALPSTSVIGRKVSIGETNILKLSEDDIAIATNKGWTLI